MNDLLEAIFCDRNVPSGIIEDALKDPNPAWEENEPLASLDIVEGRMGSRSDRNEWLVAGFLVKEKARRLTDPPARLTEDGRLERHFVQPPGFPYRRRTFARHANAA